LRDLVQIESGSKDIEGLDQIAELIARLRALGGEVSFVEAARRRVPHGRHAAAGRMVQAVFKGRASAKILLIGHMDTVYLKGMLAQQPFRVDGNRAYGLGIADDKQGVAAILHTVTCCNKLGLRDYGQLTVLINGDEEISSPASRQT
jgi:glutamate carboxypeptidase